MIKSLLPLTSLLSLIVFCLIFYVGCTSTDLPPQNQPFPFDQNLQNPNQPNPEFTYQDQGAVGDLSSDQSISNSDQNQTTSLLGPFNDLDVDQIPSCPQDRCGLECTDLQTDLRNCGVCGRTCLFPNASALCIDGECILDQCEDPYQDRDQDESNGCELESVCNEGVSCELECGAQGQIECINDEPLCVPPEELCNLEDDNCNGECDEGALNMGCRVQIHRGYGSLGHIYHSDLGQLTANPFRLESENYFSLYQTDIPNGRPVFFCKTRENNPFLSNQTDCGIQRSPLMTLGFWSAIDQCGSIPLYSSYKPESRDHFYTTNPAEHANAVTQLQFEDRGIVGYVWQN